MEKIRLNSQRDSLIFVYREAKISLVEYDPATHELQTLAVRSLEKEEYKVRSLTSREIIAVPGVY